MFPFLWAIKLIKLWREAFDSLVILLLSRIPFGCWLKLNRIKESICWDAFPGSFRWIAVLKSLMSLLLKT